MPRTMPVLLRAALVFYLLAAFAAWLRGWHASSISRCRVVSTATCAAALAAFFPLDFNAPVGVSLLYGAFTPDRWLPFGEWEAFEDVAATLPDQVPSPPLWRAPEFTPAPVPEPPGFAPGPSGDRLPSPGASPRSLAPPAPDPRQPPLPLASAPASSLASAPASPLASAPLQPPLPTLPLAPRRGPDVRRKAFAPRSVDAPSPSRQVPASRAEDGGRSATARSREPPPPPREGCPAERKLPRRGVAPLAPVKDEPSGRSVSGSPQARGVDNSPSPTLSREPSWCARRVRRAASEGRLSRGAVRSVPRWSPRRSPSFVRPRGPSLRPDPGKHSGPRLPAASHDDPSLCGNAALCAQCMARCAAVGCGGPVQRAPLRRRASQRRPTIGDSTVLRAGRRDDSRPEARGIRTHGRPKLPRPASPAAVPPTEIFFEQLGGRWTLSCGTSIRLVRASPTAYTVFCHGPCGHIRRDGSSVVYTSGGADVYLSRAQSTARCLTWFTDEGTEVWQAFADGPPRKRCRGERGQPPGNTRPEPISLTPRSADEVPPDIDNVYRCDWH